MANGKAMTVGEMASLFLDPATPVRIDAFDGSHFGPADADLKVKIATPNCMYQLLAHPNEIGIVRSYILGDFDVDGIDYADPYPAMRKLVSLSKYVRPLTPTSIARVSAGILSHGFKKPPVPATEGPSKFARIKRGLMPHTEKADSETVSFHYDMSNEFYADFLGSSMTYTCAVFDNEHMSLEDAQANKLRLILDKLDLQPGQRLLDIGCGWGGLSLYMAEHYGAKVTAVTVSTEQFAYAREHDTEHKVNWLLEDYRSIKGRFDRIVSVGMFEHVGRKNYGVFMDTTHTLLDPSGLFLLHTIGSSTRKTGTDPWINKYIFPNGMLPSPVCIGKAIMGRYVMEDWHNFGADYDKTLMAWHQRFEEGYAEGAFQCSERVRRMYRYYLLSCAGAFRARDIQLWQIVLSPQGVEGGYCCAR